MSDFGQRIKELRKKFDLTQQGLADEIGANNKQTISDVEKGKQKSLNDDQVRIILDKYGISKTWLILGDGEMFELDKKSEATTTAIDTNKFISVPIVSAKASGSPVGEIHYDVEIKGEVSIAKMLFKTMPNINNIQAIEVIGNSMSPRINPGDYVIVDKKDNFDHDGVYVLQFDSMLLVKRLQVTTRGIKIISDNRSYDEDVYDPNDDQRMMHIVGKVILVINRDMASF
ncbi:XRE family transcriptional regulator [Sulfuricurvum sp.]|uniref:XRE family transcriptional regulator n=1 Tax=Sulfuricurvum sp. TaxID=2025608 RepID=UPI003BAEDD37